MLKAIQDLLDVYTLEEILQRADVTSEDALLFLVQEGLVRLPEVTPV